MTEFCGMTREEQYAEQLKEHLEEINKAIHAVLAGGQSYTIGSRSLTRADLSLLKKMKEEVEAEIVSDDSDYLLDRTFVAFFTGR